MAIRENLKWLIGGSLVLLFVSIGLALTVSEEVSAAEDDDDYRMVGYYTQWSTYGRDYQAVDIDASKLTHIVYAFADFCWDGEGHADTTVCEDIPNGTVVSADPWADYQNPNVLGIDNLEEDWDRDFYGNLGGLAKLKDENPGLKTLLSIGGWTFSKNFSNVAAEEETRENFAKSAVDFMRKYEMDGVDVDWEYPVSGGLEGNIHRPEDKQNHTKLLQAIRDELDKAEKEDGKEYELAIASSANPSYLENNELDKIAEIVSFIDIMTYDFNGAWQTTSAHNAPLFEDPLAHESDVPSPESFNAQTAIEGHLKAGVPSEKLVMGSAFYGRSWAGCDSADGAYNGGYYENCEGVGNGTWEAGVYDYDDIMNNLLANDDYKEYWNDNAQVPYLYNEESGEYVTYDNERSIGAKVAFVENNNLGGSMIWELSADRDSRLLSVMYDEYTNGETPPTPAASWDDSKVYVKGDLINYKGAIYQAKWWTKGETPDESAVWSFVSTDEYSDLEPTEPTDAPQWDSNEVYHGGDQITYQGSVFEAKWWTKGETPSDSVVWKFVGKE